MKEEKLSYLKNFNILLVEDDDELLAKMNTILSIFFKMVYCAKDGSEAYKIFLNSDIDMIITDYVMPNMNGYELCKTIRKENTSIPITVMSNNADQEKLLNVIPLSLTQYLIKPINYQILIQTLMTMLDQVECKIYEIYPLTPNIQYDRIKKELKENDEKIHLTKSEIILLELFIKNEGKMLLSTDIEYHFDQPEYKSYHAIKSIIYRLRKKIGKDVIKNIPGVGYTFTQKRQS